MISGMSFYQRAETEQDTICLATGVSGVLGTSPVSQCRLLVLFLVSLVLALACLFSENTEKSQILPSHRLETPLSPWGSLHKESKVPASFLGHATLA